VEKVAAYTDRVTPEGEWRSGNPTTNEPATPMLSPYFNMLQRELLTVLADAGIEPDKANDGQIAAAIKTLISNHAKGRNHPMATSGERGMVRYATESEHVAAERDDRATTPAGVKAMIQFFVERVSLAGPSLVYPGTTNTYTITDYSDFSTYEVSSDRGTATISDDQVTLEVAAEELEGSLGLVVKRDDVESTFTVAVSGPAIARPTLIYPGDSDTDVDLQPTLQASSFQSYPAGFDNLVNSDWQVATDENFANIVVSTTADQQNLTSWPLPEPLPFDTTVYARMRQTGETLGQTAWSPVVSFTTTSEYIVTPSITSPLDGATDVPEQPVIEVSDFATNPEGFDTHAATSWWIYDDLGNVIWQSLNDTTNLTSITPPTGVFEESGVYRVAAQFHGTTLPDSAITPEVTFTASDLFIPEDPDAGVPFAGGFFVRRMIDIEGNRYALVTAPKSEGEPLSWMDWDEAVNFCNGLTIGGHNDWKLPTLDELRIQYRVFKPSSNSNRTDHGATARVAPPLGDYTSGDPSRTSLIEFQEGNSEAFSTYRYWSATPRSGGGFYYVVFSNGDEGSASGGTNYLFRAVRRVYF